MGDTRASRDRLLRPLPALLVACALVYAPSIPVGAQEPQNSLVVGVYENPPKVFTSETGKPAGIFIDIIEHIAEQEGWTVRYVSGTWGEGLERLRRRELDLMPDVAPSPDRLQAFSFHKEPVLSSWSQAYAPADSGIRSILDLNGKRIAVLDRSVQQEAFEQLIAGFGLSATIVPTADLKSAFEAVVAGKADAAVSNRFYGAVNAKTFGLEDTAVIFQPTDLFFASPRDRSPVVLRALDRHLLLLKKDPQSVYYRSLKRWLSEEAPVRIPAWLRLLGAAVGVGLLASLAGSVVLKHQVNARTRELRQLNQEMEQRVVERTAELAAAMHKAEAADRLKSAFLASMSHELRTPLNSIIGFTGIILQGLAGPLNPEQRKQLEMVRGSARHLLALINDVLDISKIEAGQLEVARETVDVRAAVEKVAGMVKPLAEKKGLALRVELAPEVGTAAADQRRVEQVLLNLVNNAIKFTERGRVTVMARPVATHAEGGKGNAELSGGEGVDHPALRTLRPELGSRAPKSACVEITVADTGIGIKPEDLGTLFQPFRQLDSGLTRQYEGTGLGLAISRRLADLMGGDIRAESEWGKGSSFTFTLPVTEVVRP